jgi:hypothetical protein
MVPPPSPDIPPGPVVIHVPLYPGALPTTQQVSGPIGVRASPYVKAAAAMYALPTDAGTATVWYQEQFAGCGYRVSAHGQESTAQGLATSVAFTSGSNTNLTVQLAFQDTARGCLVLYVAEDVTVPPRPPGSYLPRDIVRVNVTYLLPLPQKPVVIQGRVIQGRLHRTITKPAAIHTLVAAINALRQIVAGVHTCPADNGQAATLIFVRRNGRTVRVYDEPVCVGVVVGRYPPLIDEGRRVWTTITALIRPGTGAGTMRGVKKQKQCGPSVPGPAVCDRLLGVALTVPKGWSVVPREKFPPGYLAFWTHIPGSQEPPSHLVIEPVGLASACTDGQAALAVAEALARTTTSRHPIMRRRSIVAGAPAVYLYGLPATPEPSVQIVVAHRGAVYQLIFPGSTRALQPDQWHALASLRFIPRIGPFPRRPDDPFLTRALRHCATVHRQPSPSFPRQIIVGRHPAALAIDQRTRRLFVINMGGQVLSLRHVTARFEQRH